MGYSKDTQYYLAECRWGFSCSKLSFVRETKTLLIFKTPTSNVERRFRKNCGYEVGSHYSKLKTLEEVAKLADFYVKSDNFRNKLKEAEENLAKLKKYEEYLKSFRQQFLSEQTINER